MFMYTTYNYNDHLNEQNICTSVGAYSPEILYWFFSHDFQSWARCIWIEMHLDQDGNFFNANEPKCALHLAAKLHDLE
jgi:hypothetical protein